MPVRIRHLGNSAHFTPVARSNAGQEPSTVWRQYRENSHRNFYTDTGINGRQILSALYKLETAVSIVGQSRTILIIPISTLAPPLYAVKTVK